MKYRNSDEHTRFEDVAEASKENTIKTVEQDKTNLERRLGDEVGGALRSWSYTQR